MRELVDSLKVLKIDSTEQVELNGTKYIKLGGVFAEADKINENKRVYLDSYMGKAVELYNESTVKSNMAWGKAYHPGPFDIGGAGGTAGISHRVVELSYGEDKQVRGKILVIDTCQGTDIMKMINSGGSVGISARGRGSSKKGKWMQDGIEYNDVEIVGSDYIIDAYDIVTNPAVKKAVLSLTDSVNEEIKEKEFLMDKNKLKLEFSSVYDEILNEGKSIGLSESVKQLELKDSKITELSNIVEKDKLTIQEEISKREKVEIELRESKIAFTALNDSVTKVKVKSIVDDKVNKSAYKKFIDASDVDKLKAYTSVEEAEKAFIDMESMIKKIVDNVNTKVDGIGSEANLTPKEDTKVNSIASDYIKQQREAAGLFD